MDFQLWNLPQPQWLYDGGSSLRRFFLSVVTRMASSVANTGIVAPIVGASAGFAEVTEITNRLRRDLSAGAPSRRSRSLA